MTAITAHHFETTPFERVLLRAASALDQIVAGRLERRATRSEGARAAAGAKHEQSRAVAQASGALGLLPR
jgi:hypothetical protein